MTSPEIVRALPTGGYGYTCYNEWGDVVARGDHGTRKLARVLIKLWRERKKKGGGKRNHL